ncbi:type I secretion system permease/ATPase [Novosphingobium naphthalenivorans]|uniref:type I secretion system permease/ATPase n=1 Tax=Novosphingobium naphthalenivorans TaxID=273168 RepID=UPI000A980ABD|nr:type I secretion system permease/ATPase [Novosphingobium naphthalenivorans]
MTFLEPAGEALRSALASCRRHLGAVAAFSALVNLLYIVPTLYMLQVYDRVVPTGGLQTLTFLTLVLLLALGTLALLDRLRSRLLVRAGLQLDIDLAPRILDASFARPQMAEARAALRDFDTLRGALSGPAFIALCDAPWLPVYILACTAMSPWIGLVALLGCVVLPLIAWANERATGARLAQARTIAGLTNLHQDAALAGGEAVRALGMRRALVARAMRQRRAMLTSQTEAGFAAGNYVTLTKFVRLALQSLALGLGALLAVEKQISPAAIFASSFLIARALSPIEQLIAHWKTVHAAREAWRDLDVLLASAPKMHAPTALPTPKGAVALESLVVLDPSRAGPVLHGLSLAIAAGETVAVIGPSGAGKSTLVRALSGAVRPDRGTIRIDGADMADWDAERLAVHIGYVPQAPTLFAGTVAENIARFSGETGMAKEALDAAVVEAARKVGAHDMILGLPGGYDHRLGHDGSGLSAGQAQRVALARAVFGSPALLILDEPNAHLDAEGDAQLIEALGMLKQAGTTIVVVSHKMGILPVVDRILVLREGRVVLFGPREEVMAKLAPPSARPRVVAGQDTAGGLNAGSGA